ncbi:MAG: DNA polymerase-4 [Planctomycetota bacterium]|jgi:DNA polymerase-4
MNEPDRIILHADLDAFFAAVEQRDRPELRGQPVIIGSSEARGVVATASYEARKFGVHSALPGVIAKRLCPHGIFVRPRMKAYVEASRQVFDIFRSFTPQVEGLSLDEAFLDIAGSIQLFGSPRKIGELIRRRVQEEVGLTISVGIASSKYLAKVASDLEKPDGLVEVPKGGEAQFLAPLPLSCLWGAGPKMRAKLTALGMSTIGDLQRLRESDLTKIIGSNAGAHFYRLSRGLDTRSVQNTRAAKSMSRERTFSKDVTSDEEIRQVLLGLAEDVGKSLRREQMEGHVVRLKYREPDFKTHVRQSHLARSTASDLIIHQEALELLSKLRKPGEPVRLIGLGLSSLVQAEQEEQLELFAEEETVHQQKDGQVLKTLDQIRERFGSGAIGHGVPRKNHGRDDPR